jgi:glutamine synthetase
MVEVMLKCGLNIECHHHEVATGGQCEIDQRFDTLVKSRRQHDAVQVRRPQRGQPVRQDRDVHAQAAVRRQRQRHAHHQSLWKDGKPLFAGDCYAGLSQMALWYIGGLLKHARALSAIIAPTTNSYKRLVPGYEAPVNLAYSRRNRSAAVRIPMYSASPKASASSSAARTRPATPTWPSRPC